MAEMKQQAPRAGEAAPQRATQLVTDHGRTTIADTVVAKIAARAIRDVTGVHDLVAGGVAGLAQRLGSTETAGVNVEVGQREAAIDLAMIVNYGVSIPQVAEAVRHNIIDRVQSMTGLQVRNVNIDVTDLNFPEQKQAQQSRVE